MSSMFDFIKHLLYYFVLVTPLYRQYKNNFILPWYMDLRSIHVA